MKGRMQITLAGSACVAVLVGVSLFGDAVRATPQSQSAPVLKVEPAALTFPPQATGTASQPLTITLTNGGSAALQVSDILTSGIDFAETNTCDGNLAAGAICSIAVTCTPAISGPRLGTISIMTSDPSSPRLIALSGTGQ